MNVLFIGGTGTISSACSLRAVEKGIDLTLLNRGQSVRAPAEGAKVIHVDIRDKQAVEKALEGCRFDVVVDWVAFTPGQVQADIDLFGGKVGQYIYISSASAYQTPPANLPIRESTPLDNPVWEYSRNKIACEELLLRTYRQNHFPFTIVRPSHTYDHSYVPLPGGFTDIDRMLRGKPVFVPGDGTSIWTLTHHMDFAKGFVGLLGNPRSYGETFHITSDEWLTWNKIYQLLGNAAGVEPELVHIPSDLIAAYDRHIGDSFLGDKANSSIFDNSKIKQVVPEFQATIPFAEGARQIIDWHLADPSRQKINAEYNAMVDRMLENYKKAWPE